LLLPRSLEAFEYELRGPFRVLTPKPCYLVVSLFPFWNGRPPVTKERSELRSGALVRRNGQDLANSRRQRIGGRAPRARDREPEPPPIVILIVVAIPASVVLLEAESENGPARIAYGPVGQEHSFARLIPQPGTNVDSPGRLVFPIDCVFDGSYHAAPFTLVVKYGSELGLLNGDVGCGLAELDLCNFIRCIGGRCVDLEFGQGTCPV